MQRRAGHGGARHAHRVELGHGRQLARAPDLHRDIAQQRRFLLGRELEGNRPARSTRRVAHRLLLRERVHLHDNAVDLVRQGISALQRALAERMDLFCRVDKLDVGIYVEARTLQPLQQVPLGIEGELALIAHRIHERRQIAMRRDLRILLAKAARSGVSRIGEPRLAVCLRRRVEGLEARFGHVALAAQLDRLLGIADGGKRLVAQAQRNVSHGSHVHRDVLARRTVAARRRLQKAPVLEGEGDRGAVDLQLAHKRGDLAEEVLHATEPLVELSGVHGVVERVHAPLVLDGCELIADIAAHALGRARRVDEFRMLRLERAQLVHERVERAIGDRGRIEGVIEIAVVLDLAAERLDARCRIGCLSSQFIAAEQILLLFGHIRPLHEQGPGHAGA